jgi:hypothetical protein
MLVTGLFVPFKAGLFKKSIFTILALNELDLTEIMPRSI